MMDKIQQTHMQRWAYVYLRQSSMGQVRHNQESTMRQYALRDRAEQMGWPQQRIRVLDRDLGISGTELTNREDFKVLVADVSMGKVGAVFSLEASRLSRSCSDWHRLVELCSFTGTLMMDEDGCYNPADFNDRLLLGIKGTISHAELHFIRARLHGGRMNKVRRGEYRLPLPVGYRYNDNAAASKDSDEAVCGRVLTLMEPAQLEIAVKALEELQRRESAIDKQWHMKVERADYEAQLAQRRYEEVDPSNRLVASTLEARWNDALGALEQAKRDYEEYRAKHALTATPQQRERVLSLAKDFPRLWKSPATTAQDRKRLLRLLVKDVTVERNRQANTAIVHVRWQGGATEDITIDMPPLLWERQRCPAHIVERIRELASTNTDRRITEILNEQGLQAPKAGRFTRASVLETRRKYGIPPPRGNDHEITTRQLSEMLGTTKEQVWSWIAKGTVAARKIGKQYWLDIHEEKRKELSSLLQSRQCQQ